MTVPPPDPDPATTPGLEPGGGVVPGDLPPDSAQTSGLSEPQPNVRNRTTPTTIASLVLIAVFVLLFLATGVLIILNIVT